MRPRFSLRALFVLTTIVALGCYWLILPSLSAQRFVRAINSADYRQADACFQEGDYRFLVKWNEEFWQFTSSADLEPWSFRDVVRGQRQVNLHLMYGGPPPVRTRTYRIIATRVGLLQAELYSGSMGLPVDMPRTIPTDPVS
jgi:hypothetical protein